uniref:Uncharacterized protein n=1 Tax=Nannochloropsis gaditana TaxID=72520 RepID=W7TP44_9STRA|nr:hypothetical protein Naga_100822g1 [Nannochloropsis gaditana]
MASPASLIPNQASGSSRNDAVRGDWVNACSHIKAECDHDEIRGRHGGHAASLLSLPTHQAFPASALPPESTPKKALREEGNNNAKVRDEDAMIKREGTHSCEGSSGAGSGGNEIGDGTSSSAVGLSSEAEGRGPESDVEALKALAASRVATGGKWRRGKWTPEEEVYVNRVTEAFHQGLLPLAAGTTLRSYLADKLNCDPMRITKKFSGVGSIGKCIFHPCMPPQPLKMAEAMVELDRLEAIWRRRLEEIRAVEYEFQQSASLSSQGSATSPSFPPSLGPSLPPSFYQQHYPPQQYPQHHPPYPYHPQHHPHGPHPPATGVPPSSYPDSCGAWQGPPSLPRAPPLPPSSLPSEPTSSSVLSLPPGLPSGAPAPGSRPSQRVVAVGALCIISIPPPFLSPSLNVPRRWPPLSS